LHFSTAFLFPEEARLAAMPETPVPFMNGPSWKLRVSALAASSLVLAGAEHASAAVTFSASGSDLVVTIDAPITFFVTTGTTSAQFALAFENVYTTGSGDHHGDVPSSGTSTMTLPGGLVSDGLDTWSDLGSTLGVLGPTDFYGTYYFNSPQVLMAGDVVTVSAGVVIIDGFISRGGEVPDGPATVIRLIDEGLNDLSSPVAVPEAPVALIGGLGLLSLLRRRR